MVAFLPYLMAPLPEPVASRALTTFMDSSSDTSPKTTWRPSSQLVLTVVTKNCEPLLLKKVESVLGAIYDALVKAYVLGPALAMDRRPGRVCLMLKFSSANFSP